MIPDRAELFAAMIVQIVRDTRYLDDIRRRVAELAREEFAEVAQEVIAEQGAE